MAFKLKLNKFITCTIVLIAISSLALACSNKSESRNKAKKVVEAAENTGTDETPVPIGEQKQISENFKVTLNSFDLSPDKELTKDITGKYPDGNYKYIIANITITNISSASVRPIVGYLLCVIEDGFCAEVPQAILNTKSLIDYSELGTGKSVTGDIFFKTQKNLDINKLYLYFNDGEEDVYFSLK